ncbi:hypothetical protein JCM11641_002015 [Rhodosporidiobolus odoratus]
MADPNPCLRPLTLPSLPPAPAQLSNLKQQLAFLKAQSDQLHTLHNKLQGFTDEPVWDAFIPFGPLAYFPGKLTHTNDITQALHATPADADVQENTDREDANGKGNQVEDSSPKPQRVLRSAKQAREEATRLQQDLAGRISALEKEIKDKEQDVNREREEERQKGGKKQAEEEDDWTVNERGELINEEGLPMFDIREDLPPEEPSASPPPADVQQDTKPKPKMRYLIKKGGKQVVRPLPPPSSRPSPPKSAPPSSPPSRPAAKPPASDLTTPLQPGRLTPAEIASLLDELEAEESAERAAEEAKRGAEEPPVPTEEAKAKPADSAKEAVVTEGKKPAQAPPSAFAGFAAGFLSKPKQKRPSNSLVVPPATFPASSPNTAPTPTPSTAPPAASRPPTLSTTPRLLKPALSRPSSPSSRSIFSSNPEDEKKKRQNKAKKSVVWDASVSGGEGPSASPPSTKQKKAAIVLGMRGGEGEEVEEEVQSPAVQQAAQARGGGGIPPPPVPGKAAAEVTERPIKDQVIERPMKKPVPPPGVGAGAGSSGSGSGVGGKPRVSRFRKAKDEMLAAPSVPVSALSGEKADLKGKGKAKAKEEEAGEELTSPRPPSVASPSDAPDAGPIHTISLSSRPTASTSSAPSASQQQKKKDGTISYADLDFSSGEEDPDLEGQDEDDEDGDWSYSDDEDDEEEFDVDAALHQREVALEYHRQRMRVGAGRGMGALGGYHGEGEFFGGVGMGGAEDGLVPADATLSSLSSDPSSTFGTYSGAGSAQLGKPSRFRQSNRHLESAQLIIPSLLASDPTLTTSHTMLGPAMLHDEEEAGEGGEAGGEDGMNAVERARLQRTLEAIAEGKPLPEDEQREEREKEVLLRGDYAKELQEREERKRTAGKAPPELKRVIPQKATPVSFGISDPSAPSSPAPTFAPPPVSTMQQQQQEPKTQEEELAELLAPLPTEVPSPVPVPVEAEKPKKMSRFRQKQLGLID